MDAFAGSGAVGIEALSRGASFVYFLETGKKALTALETNLSFCEESQWRIYTVPALKALEIVRDATSTVDIFYFDPPYDFGRYDELLIKANSLFPEAELILESSTRSRIAVPPSIREVKRKDIGETRLQFFAAS